MVSAGDGDALRAAKASHCLAAARYRQPRSGKDALTCVPAERRIAVVSLHAAELVSALAPCLVLEQVQDLNDVLMTLTAEQQALDPVTSPRDQVFPRLAFERTDLVGQVAAGDR
jgi:hypothetical protein